MKVWKDVNEREYNINEISDGHLRNIINFMAKGGGNAIFLDDEKITRLYKNAVKRKLIVYDEEELKKIINTIDKKRKFICVRLSLIDWMS